MLRGRRKRRKVSGKDRRIGEERRKMRNDGERGEAGKKGERGENARGK